MNHRGHKLFEEHSDDIFGNYDSFLDHCPEVYLHSKFVRTTGGLKEKSGKEKKAFITPPPLIFSTWNFINECI